MAKPLWGGKYFHPENCSGPWDLWAVRRTRDSEYFCIRSEKKKGLDTFKASNTEMNYQHLLNSKLWEVQKSFQIHLPLETNFRCFSLPVIKHRYQNHFCLVSFITFMIYYSFSTVRGEKKCFSQDNGTLPVKFRSSFISIEITVFFLWGHCQCWPSKKWNSWNCVRAATWSTQIFRKSSDSSMLGTHGCS